MQTLALSALTESFLAGASSVRNAPELAPVIVAAKIARIAERIAAGGVERPEWYAWASGANAARDAVRRAECAARLAARFEQRARAVVAFSEHDADMMRELALSIEVAREYWVAFHAATAPAVGESLAMIEMLYIERLRDADLAVAFPGVKRDARYQRKKRALDYVLEHGGCSPALREYMGRTMRHVASARRVRAEHSA